MTTAEMVTAVKSRGGFDSTSQISDVQIVDFLNQRQRELCADTNVLLSVWTTSTVANQQQYTVPTDYTSVEAIQIYRTTGDMAQWWLDKRQIDELDPNKGTGTPTKFALWGLNVSGNNSPAFWLDPIPDTSGSSDLICWGRQLPAMMASGGQAPEVRPDHQYLVVNGALALCYLRLAAADPNWLPLADRYEAMWAGGKKAASEESFIDVRIGFMGRDTMGYTR